MQVLVTRPETSASELAADLRSNGLASIVMPLYTFSELQPRQAVAELFSAARGRKLAVFTSPRAVRFGLPQLAAAESTSLEIAAIGKATAGRLEALGLEVQVRAASGYTSEDLLQATALASDPGLAVIFCAPGGRRALATGLDKLGWKVAEALVYERVALQPTAGQITAIEAADDLVSVWTSISALELAHEQLPAAAWDKVLCNPALVISQRIQHHLQQLGAGRVELADGPGNADLLRSIMRLSGRKYDA